MTQIPGAEAPPVPKAKDSVSHSMGMMVSSLYFKLYIYIYIYIYIILIVFLYKFIYEILNMYAYKLQWDTVSVNIILFSKLLFLLSIILFNY